MSTKTRRQPKSGTTLEQRFLAATEKGDIRQQLSLAAPIARASLWIRGIDSDNYLGDIAELAGSNDAFHAGSNDQFHHNSADLWETYCRHVNAAFALGVALGQLVSPDAFKSGGAK